eukprot:2594898-Alexandrium_andersonii.AAC.1
MFTRTLRPSRSSEEEGAARPRTEPNRWSLQVVGSTGRGRWSAWNPVGVACCDGRPSGTTLGPFCR